MKDIIFVVGNYKNGGVPMRATNLANEFGRRGYNVTILVTKEIAKDIFFELQENVKLVLLKQYINENKNNPIIKKELYRQKKQIKFCKRLRYVSKFLPKWDEKIERKIRSIRKSSDLSLYLINNQNAVLIPFGLAYYEQAHYAALDLDFSIIYAERNAPELEVPKDIKRAKELLDILGQADGAIFQTNDEKQYYEPYINQNVAVIHNPIKKNLPEPFCCERRKVIVNFCRIAEQKNLKLLVDSFRRIQKEYPDYKLQIYGNAVEKNEETLRDELKQYIAELGIAEQVQILPPVADVHERVRDCAMFVSSSDYEGLSNSMIEAMAIGMPCVCTDCLGGGAREMIENEVNGLLVPMKDEDELYFAMKRMIDQPEFAHKCGRNASRITEEMTVEKIADKWLDVIENV